MSSTFIIGSQWGDEGKGKIIDYLSQKSTYVVRFHGGNNAGHTVINKYGKFAMHLVPSGIFHKNATSLITNGVVLDLEVLLTEIQMLEKAGIQTHGRLFISPRCHIIMPYHKLLDKLYEEAKGKAKTGTTGRGIGPVYSDKVSYNGIRIFDLLNKKQFSQKLSVQLKVKNKILKALGAKVISVKEVEKQFFYYRKKILPYIQEPLPLLHHGILTKQKILFEGAQGMFLDNDWGTYPYVTASTVLAGGINAGTGIPLTNVKNILGIVKAYTTRVGEGPFPTELLDKTGIKLQTEGGEFGATTGRPRRCGWFDTELVKTAAELNGFTGIAITKLDILDTFPKIKICTGYKYKGKTVRYYECDAEMLLKVKPLYKTLDGWNTKTNGITEYKKLPKKAREYLTELEKLIGVPIQYISTGKKTDEIIAI